MSSVYGLSMGEILGLSREALDRARRSRDPRFDGKFFIAVLSTGIYCRPICPVRLESSAVRYYLSAAEAAEAGFRPCLRCRPEAAPGSAAWSGTSAVVRRTLRLIHEGALDKGSVAQLASRVGVGARYLNRLLVDQIGASPLAIAQTRRLHFAKRLLDDTDMPLTQVALAAGYGSVRRFNGALKATYNRSPRELRKGRASRRDAVDEITLRLAYRPPFDWPFMRSFLARHAVAGIELVNDAGYSRTVVTSSGHALITITACEGANALQMRIQGAPPADLFELSSNARRMFDLAADPLQINDALREDPLLSELVLERPGMRIPGIWDPFECAVRVILGEQVNVDFGCSLTSRLVARAGRLIAPEVGGLTHVFPSPLALAEMDLTGLGITPMRTDALRALGRAVHDGAVRFNDSVDDLQCWSIDGHAFSVCNAQYVALRALGEPDAFPAGDLALRRRAGSYDLPLTPRALEARAEAWRPWRGYAAFHLWAAADDAAQRVSKAAPIKRASHRSERVSESFH